MTRRMSRNNSQSSSLQNNRLSIAEAAGPDALPAVGAQQRGQVRNGSSVGMTSAAQQPQNQPNSASGTLKRGTLSRQQSQRDRENAPQVNFAICTDICTCAFLCFSKFDFVRKFLEIFVRLDLVLL